MYLRWGLDPARAWGTPIWITRDIFDRPFFARQRPKEMKASHSCCRRDFEMIRWSSPIGMSSEGWEVSMAGGVAKLTSNGIRIVVGFGISEWVKMIRIGCQKYHFFFPRMFWWDEEFWILRQDFSNGYCKFAEGFFLPPFFVVLEFFAQTNSSVEVRWTGDFNVEERAGRRSTPCREITRAEVPAKDSEILGIGWCSSTIHVGFEQTPFFRSSPPPQKKKSFRIQ